GGAYAQGSCDRECLRSMLDRYLAAVVAHDPGAAPVVTGFRQTENAINVAPGNGVWRSVTGLGEVQRKYFDAVSGQAAYFGTVEEGDAIAIVTVRVRVENRAITEAEWYIARADDPGLSGARQPGRPPANLHNPEYLARNQPPQRVVPRAERADRDTLIRVVESYFDALTSHDRTVALAHEGCGRVENGSPAPAGQFLPPAAPANASASPGAPGPGSRDCLAGLENFNLQMVVARRIPLVDVEAQVVLSYGVFIRRPGSPTPRNVFSEWFAIEEGKIRTIYTAMFYPPADLAVPNWPPFDGNWPLPATTVPAPAESSSR
ncbi:MAG TPA: hypothetical protein VFO94_10595, partial [Gammaproteobacteria bacterium]|nr:hypothetical protein [Gammaproteobacteria bacterium]